MRIGFHKVSDEQHQLVIGHGDGRSESVLCETRSYLTHDFLHLAVEAEAGLQRGFWGRLAAGASLAELNDRSRPMDDDMADIEQIVGALTGTTKGRSSAELVAGMRRFAAQLGRELPAWLTEAFVEAVHERMRRLSGQWRATAFGATMYVDW